MMKSLLKMVLHARKLLQIIVTNILIAQAQDEIGDFTGITDNAGNYQMVAVIATKYGRLCTGSVIAPLWVLTAAHCDIGLKMTVHYGTNTVPPWKTETKAIVLKTIIHPKYKMKALTKIDNEVIDYIIATKDHHDDLFEMKLNIIYGGFENDIALLSTKTIISLEMYGFLNSADYRTLIEHEAVYVGYGDTNVIFTVKRRLADQKTPRKVGMGYITNCEKPLKRPVLCVVQKCSKTVQNISLALDSGAPLWVDDRIVGILSSFDKYQPSVSEFTPVSPYIGWINRVIRPPEKKKMSKLNTDSPRVILPNYG